jgi:hypothetical protein
VIGRADDVYERYIRRLPPAEQPPLLALLAHDLAAEDWPQERSLLELDGLGAARWQGVDAQTYVHAKRDEWDRRS